MTNGPDPDRMDRAASGMTDGQRRRPGGYAGGDSMMFNQVNGRLDHMQAENNQRFDSMDRRFDQLLEAMRILYKVGRLSYGAPCRFYPSLVLQNS